MGRPKTPDLSLFDARQVAGIDEAGRGCLAGPVVAAAVILHPGREISGLADSKTLSPRARENLALQIKTLAAAWSVGIVWQKRIDEINILQATFEAMAKAVARLKPGLGFLLVDGNKIIPESVLSSCAGFSMPQKAIIDGDALVPAISAASIVAKTFRDNIMQALAKKWPGYGFDKHKGYGTKKHYEALRLLGPSPLHRLTFRGVSPLGKQCILPGCDLQT